MRGGQLYCAFPFSKGSLALCLDRPPNGLSLEGGWGGQFVTFCENFVLKEKTNKKMMVMTVGTCTCKLFAAVVGDEVQ